MKETEEEYTEILEDENDSQEKSYDDGDEEDRSAITLELGDIIEILAPTNSDIHESTFYIDYIDENQIDLIHIASLQYYKLIIAESGGFTDESITEIILHSRSKDSGYAIQHKLLPKTWINIHFGGEFPAILTGEISDLIEDQIEIITYPDLTTIYIDFAYKGIPKDLPLEKIVVRDKPAPLKQIDSLQQVPYSLENDVPLDANEEDISIEYLDNGEAILKKGESDEPIPNIQDTLHDMYRKTQGIIIGETLEEVTQYVEIPESQKQYGLDTQLNSMIDEFLSTIPNYQRTHSNMEKIYILVERYKELREMYSKFDENENVRGFKIRDPTYKPLVHKLRSLDSKIKWILPVVALQKKYYPEQDDQVHDTEDLFIHDHSSGKDILNEIELQKSTYYENKVSNGMNRYYSMYETIHEYGKPFIDPSKDDFLVHDHVKTNLEAIVENLDDHYSSAFHSMNIVRSRYVIQTYNLGLSKIETVFKGGEENVPSNSLWRRCSEGGKRTTKKTIMTPSDKIAIKSLVVFPKSVANYSKLYLPSTNILDRVNLHHTNMLVFRLLNKKMDIMRHTVDTMEKEVDYEEYEKETQIGFLGKTTEYVLSDENMSVSNKYEEFLQTIFPKTRVFVKIMEKYIQNQLSFVDVIRALEPFFIYSSDVTYKQYSSEIRYFIKTKIEEIKKKLNKKSVLYNAYKNTKYDLVREIIPVLRLFLEKTDSLNLFLKSYRLGEKEKVQQSLSSHEIIHRISLTDNNRLFSTLLSSIMISLRTPNDLSLLTSDDMGKSELLKAQECNKRRLAKKYSSIEELQKENHTDDVFFDKNLDKTPYSIMLKYKDDQKNMLPDKFVKFLEENLVQKHNYPRDKVHELSKILIEGKKRVESGDYAIVEIKPQLPKNVDEKDLSAKEKEDVEIESEARMRMLYYQRKGTTWVQDKDIDEEAFIDDDLLLCNLSKNCVKNLVSDQCESNKEATQRLMGEARNRAMKEFDRRYKLSTEELQQSLEKELNKQLKFINKWNILSEIQRNKSNMLEYEIGNMVQVNENIESPYLKLRDMILAQDDFVKKQYDIVNFAAKFTREPIFNEGANEEQHWKYCKETNTKLLPDFFVILAQEFLLGSSGNYAQKLAEICVSHGEKHDDMVWDKYSGYAIRKEEFSTEEGYTDTGFKMKTHDVLEITNLENLKMLEKTNQVFESKESEMIYKVFYSLCKNIDIPTEEIESNVLRISMDLVKNKSVVSSEESYEKRRNKMKETKGIQLPSYSIYCNEMIVIITTSVLLTCIQSIQTLKTNKTFPGCVRSFSGYPLDGMEDLSTIEYMACVLEKMRNASTEPWNAIYKIKRDGLKTRIKTLVEQFVVNNADIEIMLQNKREYLIKNPTLETIPYVHNVKKWAQFLPPVLNVRVIKHLQPLGSDFKNDFIELMRRGDKHQREDYNMFKSKIIYYSYAIIEAIQEVVKTKNMLLKTLTNVPYLQNACCNENIVNPMNYFKKEYDSIIQYMKVIESLVSNVYYVQQLSKAGSFFDPKNTKLRMRNLESRTLSDQNIYATIIHYSGLDKHGFIDPLFHPFFTELPRGYNKKASLDEKIVLLKNNGKIFTPSDVYKMMKIIHKKNTIQPYKKQKYSFVEILRDLIKNFENVNSSVIEDNLREKLRKCLNYYHPTKMYALDDSEEENDESETPNKILENLKNYLLRANNNMYKEIIQFINEYGNLRKKDFERISEFLKSSGLDCSDENRVFNLQSWNIDCHLEKTGAYYDNGLYSVFNFIKHSIYDMTHVLPQIILNNMEYTKVPEHWGLGDKDKDFIREKIENYANVFNKYKNDSMIIRLLQEIKLIHVDLYLFISNLPIHTPIIKNGVTFYSIFDKKTCYQLIFYIFYSVFLEYIELAHNENMLKIDIYEKKMERRNNIREKADVFSNNSSNYEDLDERLVDIDEDLNETQLLEGKQEDLKTRVASLLVDFINNIQKNKTILDMTYEDISEKIRDSKKREKDMIIKRLDKLTKEERRVENMMKEFKLGKWNVGEQRGLVVYDQETQDRERQEMVEQGVLDIEIQYDIEMGELDEMLNQTDVQQMERDQRLQEEMEIENEGLDFGGLGEDYNDGYGDDTDMGDFPED